LRRNILLAKNKISYGNLKTGQEVGYSFTQTGIIYELSSIDVTKPQLSEDTIVTKPKTFTFTGTIQSMQPFNQYVSMSSNGTIRALVISTACKFKKGKKGANFSDLKIGQTITVEAQKLNGNRFDPISITIQ